MYVFGRGLLWYAGVVSWQEWKAVKRLVQPKILSSFTRSHVVSNPVMAFFPRWKKIKGGGGGGVLIVKYENVIFNENQKGKWKPAL